MVSQVMNYLLRKLIFKTNLAVILRLEIYTNVWVQGFLQVFFLSPTWTFMILQKKTNCVLSRYWRAGSAFAVMCSLLGMFFFCRSQVLLQASVQKSLYQTSLLHPLPLPHFPSTLCLNIRASPVAQMVKHLPAMWETQVQSLGQKDPLKKEMATHSSTLAWKIPWTEEPGMLQSMGSQRVGHNWVTSLSLSYFNTERII